MLRSVMIVAQKRGNAHLYEKVLVAKRDIRKGEMITVAFHPLKRSQEEKREIDRLAKVSYEHALRSG